jgi:hypothetical protein
VPVSIVLDKTKDVFKSIQGLAKDRVMVGVPASDPLGSSAGPNQRAGVPINNASLAYIHEFGAPGANIPARPFLVPGVANVQQRVLPYLKAAGTAALDGKSALVEKNLHAVGLLAQASVRAKITDGPFVPLKLATIAGRLSRHKGRRATGPADVRPLIDTGQLRAAVSYVLRKL